MLPMGLAAMAGHYDAAMMARVTEMGIYASEIFSAEYERGGEMRADFGGFSRRGDFICR